MVQNGDHKCKRTSGNVQVTEEKTISEDEMSHPKVAPDHHNVLRYLLGFPIIFCFLLMIEEVPRNLVFSFSHNILLIQGHCDAHCVESTPDVDGKPQLSPIREVSRYTSEFNLFREIKSRNV